MGSESKLEQFDSLKQELITAKANQKNALIALGRNPSDVWETYPSLLRAVQAINSQSEKVVEVNPSGMTITPDSPYTSLLKAIIKGEPNFQPFNIRSGIEIWGKIGTASSYDTVLDIYDAYEAQYNNYVLEVI